MSDLMQSTFEALMERPQSAVRWRRWAEVRIAKNYLFWFAQAGRVSRIVLIDEELRHLGAVGLLEDVGRWAVGAARGAG